MFTDLIKCLCNGAGVKIYAITNQLGYKTPSALQSVISKQDLRLSILIKLCILLGYTITITNNSGVSVNINDYYTQRQNGQQ